MVAHRMPKLNVATLNKINVANTSFKNQGITLQLWLA